MGVPPRCNTHTADSSRHVMAGQRAPHPSISMPLVEVRQVIQRGHARVPLVQEPSYYGMHWMRRLHAMHATHPYEEE